MCTSAASANGKHKVYSPPQSHWTDYFKHKGGGGYPGHGGRDCDVPEINASGLPSIAAVVLGGVAIVLSRRTRRSRE